MYAGKDVPTDELVPYQMGSILQDSLLKADVAMKAYSKLIDVSLQATQHFKELHAEDAREQRDLSVKYSQY